MRRVDHTWACLFLVWPVMCDISGGLPGGVRVCRAEPSGIHCVHLPGGQERGVKREGEDWRSAALRRAGQSTEGMLLDSDGAEVTTPEEADGEPRIYIPRPAEGGRRSLRQWLTSSESSLFNVSWARNESALHSIREALLSNRLVLIHNALRHDLGLSLEVAES